MNTVDTQNLQGEKKNLSFLIAESFNHKSFYNPSDIVRIKPYIPLGVVR